MYPRMLDSIKAKELLPSVMWDAVVDSSVVGYQKPDEEIYCIAEEMASVKPEAIFFIDNSEEHVEAAKNRGWQAMLYDPQNPEKLSNRVAEYLEISL